MAAVRATASAGWWLPPNEHFFLSQTPAPGAAKDPEEVIVFEGSLVFCSKNSGCCRGRLILSNDNKDLEVLFIVLAFKY